jgi:hypothetical protein
MMVAQDWELFPFGQRSYFQRMSWGNRENVDMYLMDSVRTLGEEQILYFRSRLEVGGAEHCTEEIFPSSASVPIYTSNPNAISSLRQQGDTVFYEHSGSAVPFFFLTNAQVGTSWTIVSTHPSNTYQQITITCASIGEESFWGVTDSVKTFTMTANGSSPGQVPVSNFTMRLSKTFGLLEFVPFHLFLIHPPNVNFSSTRCIGIDRDGSRLGFKLPGLADHFLLVPGDLRLWKSQHDPVMQPSIISYHLDSVEEVMVTTDTIRITSKRWTQHPGGTVTGPFERTEQFTNEGSGEFLASPDNWVAVGHDPIWAGGPIGLFNSLWLKDEIFISLDQVSGDTIVTSYFFSGGYEVDTTTCGFNYPTDTWMSIELRTGIGLVEYCPWLNSPWQDCTTLIGSRIGGVVNGPIALSMREYNSSTEVPMLFPNPVNDLLFIRDHHSGQSRMCEIIDASGKVVLTTQYLGDGISVSDMPKGIYVLRIHDISGQQHARFVKH